MNPRAKISGLFALLLSLSGCLEVPENIKPVEGVDLNRYLGKWYEIVRLDHSFESGVSQVTATYSIRPEDGGIKVVNQGFVDASKKWKVATGRAYPVGSPTTGHLRVSFFGPFFGSYVIVDLDQENYQYTMITGSDRSYFWILSRTPQMDPEVVKRLVAKAEALGFETKRFLYVNQDSALAR
jgi:apolipoprotein D and lipocalin family protein